MISKSELVRLEVSNVWKISGVGKVSTLYCFSSNFLSFCCDLDSAIEAPAGTWTGTGKKLWCLEESNLG
ncbi:hypothetical protein WICPIJ_007405 [Wickerhamomyces pijperi]|uniref:Uncharacterized protein n=1 Tax=Wickerhamomyces pijperi TaxID=599730 RepID=A0A9P8TK44_WICPI|nr:hypothetical protein WICPIJ_007405 [Wickerhamomyces pijperi]